MRKHREGKKTSRKIGPRGKCSTHTIILGKVQDTVRLELEVRVVCVLVVV